MLSPSQLLVLAGLVVIGIIFFVAIVRWSARQGTDFLLKTEYISKQGKTLVVLAHGKRSTVKWMEGVRRIIVEMLPEADLLFFRYPSHRSSNADPFLIASQMCESIHERHTVETYNRILLVGYSKGALLLRKAYVYGKGRIEDLPGQSGNGEERAVLPWTGVVERLVLVAGMNRGWTLGKRHKGMGLSRWLGLRFVTWLARLTGTAKLMLCCEQGHPFVSNLRIQWLDLMRALPKERRPVVIQLLGDRDELVSMEDHRDVTVAKDFIWVTVNNSDHCGIVNLEDPAMGRERAEKLRKSFGDETALEQLRQLSVHANEGLRCEEGDDAKVGVIVVVLHGIRDMAEWTSRFEDPLQEAFRAFDPAGRSELRVLRPSYGFFGLGPFLLWSDRQDNVRWFMDEFTEWKANYPNLREIHFIGHSNGTYVLGSALKKYAALRVNRIAFAGSVVRRDYDWRSISSRIGQVRNYVGASDWVVGWFPRLFEMSPFTYLNRDLGSAGFNGFIQPSGNNFETRFVRGEHGAALAKENIPSIVDFIINGKKTDCEELLMESRAGWLDLSSRICWVIWLAIFCVLVGLGWLLAYLSVIILPGPFTVTVVLSCYLFALFLILKNI